MKKGLIALLVIVVIIAAVGGMLVSKYNTLVTLNEDVDASLSQIDN